MYHIAYTLCISYLFLLLSPGRLECRLRPAVVGWSSLGGLRPFASRGALTTCEAFAGLKRFQYRVLVCTAGGLASVLHCEAVKP